MSDFPMLLENLIVFQICSGIFWEPCKCCRPGLLPLLTAQMGELT